MSSASAALRAKRANALQALKAKRTGGSSSLAKHDDDSDDGDLYDEVSEQEYKSILRGRMMDDDFIEDDDGSGYVDDGRNEWERSDGEDQGDSDDSESAADYFERTGRKKKQTKKNTNGSSKKSPSLVKAFAKQPAARNTPGISASASARKAAQDRSAAAMDAYRPKVNREKEEDFMKRLMGDLSGAGSPPASSHSSTAAPYTPSPAPSALRGYPGRASGYGLASGNASSPWSSSRKRPYAATTAFSNAPAVTYRGSANSNGYPSSPSEDQSAPSSDLPEISSDGPDAHVHISGSDTPPWKSKGRYDVGSDSGAEFGTDLDLNAANKRIKSTKAVVNQIGALGLDAKQTQPQGNGTRPRALRMETGGPSDEDDDDADEFAIQATPVRAVGTTNGAAKRRMNVSAQVAQPATATPAKHQQIEGHEKDATAQNDKTPTNAKGHAAWQTISATLKTVDTGSVTASPSDATAAANTSSPAHQVNAFNDDRTLPFYWIDHIELEAGVILLIGKVKDRYTGKFVSACLRVQGIERCVFLLMRSKQFVNGHETDQEVTEDHVYDEFDEIREKHGIKNFLGKMVTRSYAFELPGVPATGNYLKVKYGFDEPVLPTDFSGKTFSRAFGTQTSAMELFLVKRKIMGPCWLKVESADLLDVNSGHKPLSWCKIEYNIDDAKFLSPYSDIVAANGNETAAAGGAEDDNAAVPKEVPPLTIASLAMRTVHNHQANKREIVAISLRTWSDAQLEDVKNPEERPSSVWTSVRPLAGQWPTGFEAEVRKQGGKIKAIKWERALLNGLLAQLQLLDPDIMLTHDFAGSDLDVLLARMRELRVDHWSRVGRFRRAAWPKLRNGWNVSLMKGRLCCDLSSDVGKSMISSTTWALTEMVGTHLKVQREDIDPDDVPSYFDSAAPTPTQLLTFVQHCEVDTFFLMSLAHKVQILPLTKQLTNLAGNTWARTLSGGRAERNEYILLHDFHRRKFVVPDKISGGKRAAAAKAAAAAEAEAQDGGESKAAGKGKKSKKDKYKGGLVFDPKRGLWDRYILVMDFNSLYPSIIQEYNIDFTTVDRSRFNVVDEDEQQDGDAEGDDGDGVPDIPSSDVSQGVLPNLIAKLVERRRQVKSLMKDKRAPAHKQLQWNVKQLALKLTANSMYGCLGFEGSRFYARPLAALTTFKGREILTATKELAESFGLDVIYGDTDSVMINTNAVTYAQASRIGHDFRKAVNERYKLLEIDIDAVFERMLLLQKKKYAARKVEEVEVLPSGEEKKKVTTEIKGLDMKRREYSALSKMVSSYVLDQIMSGESTENVVEAIHTYLGQIGDAVREGKIPLDDFVIYKRLGKDPKAYGNNISGQPHVHVALKMQERGLSARMGDVIPYIFCLGTDGSSSSRSAQSDRAHHRDELRKQDTELKIDYEHYLALQVLPPIERLCESIQGTDRARLAECLGLDASRYATSSSAQGGLSAMDRDFVSLDSQTPDEIRFAQCEKWSVKCTSCGEVSTFEGLSNAASSSTTGMMIQPRGVCCTSESCGIVLPMASLAIQLEQSIRAQIQKYYTSWQVCSEPACGNRTRMIGVYAKKCLLKSCRGDVSPEYTDKQLYDQLCYYASLFEKGKVKNDEEVQILASRNREVLNALSKVSAKYLERNARRFVDLSKVFVRGRPARVAAAV